MEKAYILLDVGGTQIKGGVADGLGNLEGELLQVPSRAKESRELVFDHLLHFLHKLMQKAGDREIAGVGMAFPGPFDYERGISLMKGLDKYESIYGISIPEELRARDKRLEGVRFSFLHDVEAFAIGTAWFGEGRDAQKLLCLCIGTGAGSAFLKNKQPLKEEGDGVPLHGWLYNAPYKESVIDEYLSVRGLERISRQVVGEPLSGKELYERCRRQEETAKQAYRMFGEDVTMCMVPFLDGFKPDGMVLGGQISKSFSYFGAGLLQECRARGIDLYLEPETSIRAMQGLFITMEQEEKGC